MVGAGDGAGAAQAANTSGRNIITDIVRQKSEEPHVFMHLSFRMQILDYFI